MAAPSLAVLDNFNRANGGLGANWTTGFYAGSVAPTITSNQVAGNASYAEAWWNPASYTESEAYITVATLQNTGEVVYLEARAQTPGSNFDGYELLYTRGSGMVVNRVVNEAATQLGATIAQELTAGDRMGMVVLGTGATVTIEVWRFTAGAWSLLATRTDTDANRITAAGRIGFGSNSATVRLDDFGGGEQVAAGVDLPLLPNSPLNVLMRM